MYKNIYKKNKNLLKFEEEILCYLETYFQNRIKKLNINATIKFITTKDSEKNNKYLKLIDTVNLSLLGSCNEENKITINLSNFIFKSYFINPEENFASLIETINHELSHARDNSLEANGSLEYYKNLKFSILGKLSKERYNFYYKNYDGELKAFLNGYNSIIEEFNDDVKFESVVKKYKQKIKNINSLKTRDFYEDANVYAIDEVFYKNSYHKAFIENYQFLKYEYKIDGTRKNLYEIIISRDSNIQDELYYHIGYTSFSLTNEEIEINDEILKFINYGLEYEFNRIKLNNENTTDIIDRKANEKYLLKKIEKIKLYLEKGKNNGKVYKK